MLDTTGAAVERQLQ